MKVRAVILAGGAGTRLGVLTAKRTKPAVPFAGKYRIIDFPLSNCVNSDIFDVMIVAQYRPHSLMEHIGAGGPWDLNRDFTGGIHIYTPYLARAASWFAGTADAIQQNFLFIKRGDPDLILILSGDHIYTMDFRGMINQHLQSGAAATMGVIRVPMDDASRYGIVGVGENNRITSFVEKPKDPPSNLANMGIYLFNRSALDVALWRDHLEPNSSHDFGKDILPKMLAEGQHLQAYPYDGYWVDVGTIESYWQTHMDLLKSRPSLDLFRRDWIIHTRTEERPPALMLDGSQVIDSLICDGVIIEPGARVVRSVLSPGVVVSAGAIVEESVVLTDTVIGQDARIVRAILDKRVNVGEGAIIGEKSLENPAIPMIGKNARLPERIVIQPGASVGVDVQLDDFTDPIVRSGSHVKTRRLPNEV